MKLLLDENLPKRLKENLSEYEVFTVAEKGWNGKTNGDLLKLMLKENFQVLITFDKNLQHQQNFVKSTLTVFVLNAPDNTYLTLKKLVDNIKIKLSEKLNTGVVIISE